MFYMYILVSAQTNRYYVGCTNDVNKRLEKHNNGYVHSTKAYIPWKLIYFEKYKTLKETRAREKQIKNWKSREAIEKLIDAPFV